MADERLRGLEAEMRADSSSPAVVVEPGETVGGDARAGEIGRNDRVKPMTPCLAAASGLWRSPSEPAADATVTMRPCSEARRDTAARAVAARRSGRFR